MPFVDSTELSTRERLPGWTSRVFHSDSMTFAYYEIAAAAVPLHEHHHPQEEVWNVIDGKLAVTIDGVEQVAGPGCAAVVPPDTRSTAWNRWPAPAARRWPRPTRRTRRGP